METQTKFNSPTKHSSKTPKRSVSENHNNRFNNRRNRNNSYKTNNNNINDSSKNNLFCFSSTSANILPSITSPNVRRLTVFPEELIASMTNASSNIVNISTDNSASNVTNSNCNFVPTNYNDVVTSVIGTNPSMINSTALGNIGSNVSVVDFLVPQSQDSQFVNSSTLCWRTNTLPNTQLIPMGRCMHHGHYNLINSFNALDIDFFQPQTSISTSLNQPLVNLCGSGDNTNILMSTLPNTCNVRNCSSAYNTTFTDFGAGDGIFSISHKIYIPHNSSYNFIGRILGPRGNSVRRLESLTGCKILIRGKGSIKDSNQEAKMRNIPGWEHLNEDLHVLITAEDNNEQLCQIKLRRAALYIQRLLTPQFDEYKRQQLIQLAIINGTYRP